MVAVRYHTDPACPWSWALEPSVRKLIVDFGDELRWTFVMGGLARSFAQEGSRAPVLEPKTILQLVTEWLEASAESRMPVDPLVWLEHPIRSTYPACMAVKAAAERAEDGGYRYLRRLREGIMCERRRLDHTEALVQAGREAGLEVERFRLALSSHAITEAFGTDLERTAALAAEVSASPAGPCSRGTGGAPLPSLLFEGEDGNPPPVLGLQPYERLHEAAVAAGAKPVRDAPLSIEEAIERFGRVATSEVEVLCGLAGPRAGAELFRRAEQWKLRGHRRLTEYIWEPV